MKKFFKCLTPLAVYWIAVGIYFATSTLEMFSNAVCFAAGCVVYIILAALAGYIFSKKKTIIGTSILLFQLIIAAIVFSAAPSAEGLALTASAGNIIYSRLNINIAAQFILSFILPVLPILLGIIIKKRKKKATT